jgi:hypothetical protein
VVRVKAALYFSRYLCEIRSCFFFNCCTVAHSHAVWGELPQLTSLPTSRLFSNSKLTAQHFQVFYTAPEVIRPYCATQPRFRGIYPNVGIPSMIHAQRHVVTRPQCRNGSLQSSVLTKAGGFEIGLIFKQAPSKANSLHFNHDYN